MLDLNNFSMIGLNCVCGGIIFQNDLGFIMQRFIIINQVMGGNDEEIDFRIMGNVRDFNSNCMDLQIV